MIRRLFQPWAGVIGGLIGWYLSQQSGASMVFSHCGAGRPWSVGLIGIFGLLIVAIGAWLSWRVWREDRGDGSGRQFVGLLGTLVAALLTFPILMQTIAGLLVPGCGA